MNIIVTGGHTGIGLALVQRLVSEGHRVGLLARSEKRLAQLRDLISPKDVDFFETDLASQDAIRSTANAVNTDWGSVDVLFNNAGVLLGDLRKSPQGNEMHYEVNTLAPMLLTHLLKPSLDAAGAPVVVNTSTDPVGGARSIDFETLHRPKKIVKLFGSYVVSKVAVGAAMESLARSSAWSRARVFNVAPGAIKTDMTAGGGMPFWLKPIRNLIFSSPDKGAEKLYECAFSQRDRFPSPAFVVKGKPRPMKLQLDREGFSQVLMGLNARDALVEEVFGTINSTGSE
ncbi:MAG: SDR family oxidoreductase [Myxococcota bacterium]